MAPASFHHITNTVCVMDASGSLGFSLVERLLQRGYTVHAAVQNHDCNAQSLSSFYLFIDLLLTSYLAGRLSFCRCFCMHGLIHNCLGWFESGELQFGGLSCDKKKLKILYADPFDYKSIIDALRGCCGVFYNFEPPQDQSSYDVS
jgi:hypothetical protein